MYEGTAFGLMGCALLLTTKLLRAKVVFCGSKMVIIAPYQAQCKLLNMAKALFHQADPDLSLEHVQIIKIDKYQGDQNQITICDMVVCRELGFMRSPPRINVMISRSQAGLYIIGNAGQIEKNKDRSGRTVKALINYTEEHRWVWTIYGREIHALLRTGLMLRRHHMVAEPRCVNA